MVKLRTKTVIYALMSFLLLLIAKSNISHGEFFSFYLVLLIIMIFHSIEEQITFFHERFPLRKFSFNQFYIFEIVFILVFIIPLFIQESAVRTVLLGFFPVLMFANGIWHIVWFWFFEKGSKYVPGLITALLFVITFLVFYYRLFFTAY